MHPCPSRQPPTLRPYQVAAREYLATRRAALLAADPGLGKTAVATRAALQVGARRMLVLVPAVARVAWLVEAPLWGWDQPVVCLGAGVDLTGPCLVLVTYGQFAREPWRRKLAAAGRWDVLVCDEAQKLKEPGSVAAQTVYGPGCADGGLVSRADRVWLLSGTPAPNHYGEVWTHLRRLAPERVANAQGVPMGQSEFFDRVVHTKPGPHGGQVVVGSRNALWLRQRLDGFMLRQRKRDVAADLPPLDFVDVDLDVDPVAVLNALLDEDTPIHGSGAYPADDDDFLAVATAETHVATLRRVLGRVKAPAAAAWIAEQLESGMAKIIVFALHIEVLDILHDALDRYGAVRIDGSTSPGARIAAVAEFQRSPHTRVFLGQITAAGTAITLTAASDVAMVEMSWTPSDNFQAACRAHRLGQRDGVLVRVLNVPGSFDARVSRVLRRKTADIAALLDHEETQP